MRGGEARLRINAAPEVVYGLITDVTRMGEWSPECYRCVWLNGASGPAVGARFRGFNKSGLLRWSKTAIVTAADPGREFAFTTQPGIINKDSTKWRYRFEPANGGTAVTESYEVAQRPRLFIRAVMALAGRSGDLEPALHETLARLKTAADNRR